MKILAYRMPEAGFSYTEEAGFSESLCQYVC